MACARPLHPLARFAGERVENNLLGVWAARSAAQTPRLDSHRANASPLLGSSAQQQEQQHQGIDDADGGCDLPEAQGDLPAPAGFFVGRNAALQLAQLLLLRL